MNAERIKMFEITTLPSFVTYLIHAFEWLDFGSINSGTSLQRKVYRKFHLLLFSSFSLTFGLGSYMNEDRSETLYLLTLSICAILHIFKFHFISTRMGIFFVLLKEVSMHTIQCKEKFNETEKKLKTFNYLATGLIGATVFVVLLTTAFPIVFKKVLAIEIWFPLDYKQNDLNFWIAHAYIVYCALICLLMVSFTAVIWYVMFNMSIKYQILGNGLENLASYSLSTKHGVQNSKLFYKNLVKCIECFTTLTRLDFEMTNGSTRFTVRFQ